MATTIGKLAAILTGNTKGFASAFQKAGRALSAFAGNAASVAAGIGAFTVLDGAARKLVGFSTNAFESIDAMGKLSDTLGISTEALGGLQYAAGLSGVSSEDLTTSLGKMMKTLGDAKNGSKGAIDGLARLGLSITELNGKSPDQILGVIADRLNGIKDPSVKASAAMDIFGKSALKLFPLLKEGSSGLAVMQTQAEKLGITFTRIEARQVEDANDALSTAGKILDGIGSKIAIELSPYITYGTNKLIEMSVAGEGLGTKVVNAMESVAKAIARATDYTHLWEVGFYGLQASALQALSTINEWVVKVTDGVAGYASNLIGMDIKLRDDGFTERAKMYGDAATEAATKLNDALKKISDGGNAKAVGKYFDDIRKKAIEAATAASQMRSSDDVSGLNAIPEAAAKAAKAARDVKDAKISAGAMDTAPKLLSANSSEFAQLRVDLQSKARSSEEKSRAKEAEAQRERIFRVLEDVAANTRNAAAPIIANFT